MNRPKSTDGVRTYALAVVCTGLALVLRLAMDALWGDRLPYATFFLSVLVVSQLAGTGPSVLTMVTGFLLADWFFVNPRHSLAISTHIDAANAFFYFGLSSVMIFVSSRAREARAIERASQARVSQLAAIIESSDDAIISKTLDGKIVSWNSASTKLYGYSEEEVLGQPISLLMPPERADELAPLLERVSKGETTTHFETVRRRKNGEAIEVSLSISPVRNGEGKIVGASTIARDITERRRAQRERDELLEQLRKALAEVKTLGGLLPICAHCKKIRDDKGYWNQIELYIRQHSNANFTHSVCPECARQHYPELYGTESTQ